MTNFDIVSDIPTTDKTVFLLTDLDVPIKDGRIIDDAKIRYAMKTIEYLVKTGARVVIATHLGHPASEYDERFSTRIIAEYIDKRMHCDVHFSKECVGEQSRRNIFKTRYGDIVVLENLLFHKEEKECDMNFARQLADGINVYVNDSFSYCEHTYTSVLGVPIFARSTAGLNLANETKQLDVFLCSTNKFSTAIIGGSKFSDKHDLIENLIASVKCLVVCSGVANTFLVALGKNIGKSIYEPNLLDEAKKLLDKATKSGCTVILPKDAIVANDINFSMKNMEKTTKNAKNAKDTNKENICKNINDISNDDIIVDIGSETTSLISDVMKSSKFIFWNGTIGITDFQTFKSGTTTIAKEIATLTRKKRLFSVITGNDTLSTINKGSYTNHFSHIANAPKSTLQYMSGKVLPGIEILKRLSKQLA